MATPTVNNGTQRTRTMGELIQSAIDKETGRDNTIGGVNEQLSELKNINADMLGGINLMTEFLADMVDSLAILVMQRQKENAKAERMAKADEIREDLQNKSKYKLRQDQEKLLRERQLAVGNFVTKFLTIGRNILGITAIASLATIPAQKWVDFANWFKDELAPALSRLGTAFMGFFGENTEEQTQTLIKFGRFIVDFVEATGKFISNTLIPNAGDIILDFVNSLTGLLINLQNANFANGFIPGIFDIVESIGVFTLETVKSILTNVAETVLGTELPGFSKFVENVLYAFSAPAIAARKAIIKSITSVGKIFKTLNAGLAGFGSFFAGVSKNSFTAFETVTRVLTRWVLVSKRLTESVTKLILPLRNLGMFIGRLSSGLIKIGRFQANVGGFVRAASSFFSSFVSMLSWMNKTGQALGSAIVTAGSHAAKFLRFFGVFGGLVIRFGRFVPFVGNLIMLFQGLVDAFRGFTETYTGDNLVEAITVALGNVIAGLVGGLADAGVWLVDRLLDIFGLGFLIPDNFSVRTLIEEMFQALGALLQVGSDLIFDWEGLLQSTFNAIGHLLSVVTIPHRWVADKIRDIGIGTFELIRNGIQGTAIGDIINTYLIDPIIDFLSFFSIDNLINMARTNMERLGLGSVANVLFGEQREQVPASVQRVTSPEIRGLEDRLQSSQQQLETAQAVGDTSRTSSLEWRIADLEEQILEAKRSQLSENARRMLAPQISLIELREATRTQSPAAARAISQISGGFEYELAARTLTESAAQIQSQQTRPIRDPGTNIGSVNNVTNNMPTSITVQSAHPYDHGSQVYRTLQYGE